jgi:hypothetical protein
MVAVFLAQNKLWLLLLLLVKSCRKPQHPPLRLLSIHPARTTGPAFERARPVGAFVTVTARVNRATETILLGGMELPLFPHQKGRVEAPIVWL